MTVKTTYWNDNGKYQENYNEIKNIIPDSGKTDTNHGELLRTMVNCYHDLFNNGGGNWDGNKEVQFDYIVNNKQLLIESAKIEGFIFDTFDKLLSDIQGIMNDAWKEVDYSDGCIYDCDDYENRGSCDCADGEEYGLNSFSFDKVAKLYEKLADIIIIYAFGKCQV